MYLPGFFLCLRSGNKLFLFCGHQNLFLITFLCDPGNFIMAKQGFNVQDMFVHKNIQINIPTFLKKKNRMSYSTIIEDRKISSKRVHIERIIGLAKTFKILIEPMNSSETKLYVSRCGISKICIVPSYA